MSLAGICATSAPTEPCSDEVLMDELWKIPQRQQTATATATICLLRLEMLKTSICIVLVTLKTGTPSVVKLNGCSCMQLLNLLLLLPPLLMRLLLLLLLAGTTLLFINLGIT